MPFNATLNLARQGEGCYFGKDNHVCDKRPKLSCCGAGFSDYFRVVIKKGTFFVG